MHIGEINIKIEGKINETIIPKMYKIEQIFNNEKIDDIEIELQEQMNMKLNNSDYKNKRIAITVGSRGIKHIDNIVLFVINKLKSMGAKPFIVPSMGSHAGATAIGQKEFIREYNITEESMGVEILSSMETVEIDKLDDGTPVYCDKFAYESDGIVVINKIKPHADFKGDYESGLLKMMAIGLGKHKGATTLHNKGFQAFSDIIPKVGKSFLENAPIIFGLGIVENAYDEPLILDVILKENIMEREKELLRIAKENMPAIKFRDIDILIIDEIGKNISGEGMDPNITGRPGSYLNEGFEAPNINKILVLDITNESHGNGAGIGMSDISTRKCINKINLGDMYTNSITATILGPSKLPVILNNDKEALIVAIKTSNVLNYEDLKIIRIKNTLELNEIEVSDKYYEEVIESSDKKIISDSYNIKFDNEGFII